MPADSSAVKVIPSLACSCSSSVARCTCSHFPVFLTFPFPPSSFSFFRFCLLRKHFELMCPNHPHLLHFGCPNHLQLSVVWVFCRQLRQNVPFPKITERNRELTRPGELTHTDVWGLTALIGTG